MMFFISALAVYKMLQIILALLPREVMPWVKVLAGTVLSFGAVGIATSTFGVGKSFGDLVLVSLTVATLAGVTHTVIRLLTHLGDWAARRSIK